MLDRVRDGTFDNPVDPSRAYGELATRVNEIVVALEMGEVVGFASGTAVVHSCGAPAFFVNEVGVHEDVQRQGVATRLLDRLMDLAWDRGCEVIWLATEGDNRPARGLYRKQGGKETGDIVMYDWGG